MVLFSNHSLEHPFGATPVSIFEWRAEIGIFNTKHIKCPFKSKYPDNVCPRNLNMFYTICRMFLLLLIRADDIEFNPGPRKNNISYNFSFCHWNLNSIAANNFSKQSFLEAYNAQHKFDMICLSETFLDSSIPTNDEKLNIKGYKLVRAHNPAVVQWLSLLHNFIQQNLNSGSAQIQILLAACRRFEIVRISDSGTGWK